MTWIELARHIAAMTPEQRRRPVYFCDQDNGHVYMPGLVLAEGDLPDESVSLLHGDAPVIPCGSFFLTPDATTRDAPAHPTDGLVLVARPGGSCRRHRSRRRSPCARRSWQGRFPAGYPGGQRAA